MGDAYLTCPSCLSLNELQAPRCRQCGAPLTAADPLLGAQGGQGSANLSLAGRPSTLLLTAFWLVLGPGLLMPLFFLAPGFFTSSGDRIGDGVRVGGSILYFLVAVLVLAPLTRKYLKTGVPAGPPP